MLATYCPDVHASGAMQLTMMPVGVHMLYQVAELLVVKPKAVTPYVLHSAPPPLWPVPLLVMPNPAVHPKALTVELVNGSVYALITHGPPPQ